MTNDEKVSKTPNDALADCQRYIELLKSFRKEEENE